MRNALAINVDLRDNMPFRPLTDFRLLTQVASVPEVLVVGEGVPARTWPVRGRCEPCSLAVPC